VRYWDVVDPLGRRHFLLAMEEVANCSRLALSVVGRSGVLGPVEGTAALAVVLQLLHVALQSAAEVVRMAVVVMGSLALVLEPIPTGGGTGGLTGVLGPVEGTAALAVVLQLLHVALQSAGEVVRMAVGLIGSFALVLEPISTGGGTGAYAEMRVMMRLVMVGMVGFVMFMTVALLVELVVRECGAAHGTGSQPGRSKGVVLLLPRTTDGSYVAFRSVGPWTSVCKPRGTRGTIGTVRGAARDGGVRVGGDRSPSKCAGVIPAGGGVHAGGPPHVVVALGVLAQVGGLVDRTMYHLGVPDGGHALLEGQALRVTGQLLRKGVQVHVLVDFPAANAV